MNPFERYLHLLLADFSIKYEISILDRFKIESIEVEKKKCITWLTEEQLNIAGRIADALRKKR